MKKEKFAKLTETDIPNDNSKNNNLAENKVGNVHVKNIISRNQNMNDKKDTIISEDSNKDNIENKLYKDTINKNENNCNDIIRDSLNSKETNKDKKLSSNFVKNDNINNKKYLSNYMENTKSENDNSTTIKYTQRNNISAKRDQLIEPSEPKPKKLKGRILACIVTIVLIEQYYTYVFLVEAPQLLYKNLVSWKSLRIFWFSIIFILIIGSFILSASVHPGAIPLYWGFYIGDQDFKKKRYCLICNVFKPDRTHHCSICNSCVLNMDHHCPWINNCIGFYNKKYFMQLLFYVLLGIIFLDFAYLPTSIKLVKILINNKFQMSLIHFVKIAFILLNHCFVVVLTYFLSNFFRFHLILVLNNCTTIESLDPEFLKKNKYNVGKKENWKQVFGENPWFWFLPMMHDSAYPKGDGLTWETNETIQLSEKRNNTNTSNNNNNINKLVYKDNLTNYSGYNSNANFLNNTYSESANNFYSNKKTFTQNTEEVAHQNNGQNSVIDNN